jgi:hypothetical protein
MAVIRPFNPPVINPQQAVQSPTQVRSTAEARAAQRAFFQQALGDSTPVQAAPTTAPAAPVKAAQPAQAASAAQAPQAPQPAREVRRPIPAEPPARIMRPGSFIDIKI